MLKATFLGTGTSQGVPVIASDHPVNFSNDPRDKRLRSSFMVEKNETRVVVDCSPDFRYQMLRENVQNLDAIVFTHEHNDHVLGIDDTRPLIFKAKRDLPIYGLPRVLNQIRVRFPYIFDGTKYPGIPQVEEHAIGLEPFYINDIHIQPVEVMHGGLSILGYIFDKKIAYLTDVKSLPEKTLEKLENLDVLVLSALRQENPHHAHLLLADAIEIAQKLQPKQTYFTHISVEMGFYEEVNSLLPKGMDLAYDKMQIFL
ncbi:MBL fold metallo-hydrolase [uncultured Weeksella sp.]|uniref:MBL fold metallo-hydrolase n=1 Tax=uncultured Weeksella sp. TaxID=1161389 RepID=UPI00259AEF0E|nr:MBL fold metallo-hydrolase [uncultured Weeksella sp.]